ncbi:DUF4186 domain-containing protein [Methylovorus mays]|uniref:DUF4186 domain-containing protein n=1 Tax=Methylovorus mays TaxID=184077 RepID=UPI001E3C7FD6|nr:DUF4186 domain-containing protein [Methylovorus mays]MCB5206541.1 DUF4186 domain-containing protein [Methylovorus mays]
MPSLDALFDRLQQSAFRRQFKLGLKEQAYLRDKGLPLVMQHAGEIVTNRLAAALPARDGKQTPFRGHPVFIAQHATACCCRGCLAEWHGIAQGRALTTDQQAYIVRVLVRWLEQAAGNLPPVVEPAVRPAAIPKPRRNTDKHLGQLPILFPDEAE